MTIDPRTTDVLRKRFGLDALYPLQEKVVDRILSGKDALVVWPTGSGKSLCYQLPALCGDADGVTVVFSPLIALMEDQVSALSLRGVRAQFINSTLSRKQRVARYDALARGEYELVYVTPERMHKPEFLEAIDRVPGGVRLLAVDEAHCITKWGHDFRPAYGEVGEFRRRLGSPTTIALTATATSEVRADIRTTLGLSEEEMPLFGAGIDRPNLSLDIQPVYSDEDRWSTIESLAKNPGTGIVYFSLIKSLDYASGELRRRHDGPIEIYHGKLPPAEKKRVYDRFTQARPDDRLMLLATNAFGMGVDKSDIRYIVHAQIPGSVEAYYQEVGRAGRDGEASTCRLLYSQEDLAIQQDFVDWMNPEASLMIEAARQFETTRYADLSADEVRELVIGRNRGDRRIEYCLIALEKLGVIEPVVVGERYRLSRPIDPDEIDPVEITEKKDRDLRRLLRILELTQADDIREYVLEYFELDDV